MEQNNQPVKKIPVQSGFSIKRVFLVISGLLFVGLAGLGVLLPVLPTTPFLLVAAACFIRSSDRLYQWLINHRLFGSYIRNYMRHKAISFRAKSITLILLWTTISLSAFCAVSTLWLRILLFIIALLVTIRILLYKTLTPEMLEDS